MHRKLKKSVVYVLYGLAFIFMLGGLFYIDSTNDKEAISIIPDNKYVSKDIIDEVDDLPVNASDNKKEIINRPYLADNIKIVKNYYNINDDEELQQQSLIFYQDTYIPSSGISYSNDSDFDVVAILDGKVTNVSDDDILGNVITIEHKNGIISSYQSVTDIKVKVGDSINQGDVIAKSGTSNISTDLGNHLYFELVIDGVNVDPEDYYDKSIDEL